MLRYVAVSLLLAAGLVTLLPLTCSAQQEASTRKVVNKVVPQYPALARTMNLRGIVRVEAVVASNGTVKAVQLKGGHPVLAQAAMNAVREWKWEAEPHESTEPVEIKFDP
jgi:TonB family protein